MSTLSNVSEPLTAVVLTTALICTVNNKLIILHTRM